MKLKTYIAASSLLFFILFTGCSKEVEEYNKPAFYWYSKIVEQVSQGDLDQADSYYSSLQGEHIGSPLLPEATMILAIAHMNYEEYLLSEYFLDEYIKRYATPNEKEEAEFLKIRAKYMALPNPRRDQALIDEALKKGEEFKRNYPDSMYLDVVNTMLTRLYLAQAVLNETIVNLYERLDKPKSAAYYKTLKDDSWIVWDDVDRANAAWYRAWFEGDGTSSWYEFMIPDTKSVVSRNSISEEDETVAKPVQKEESEEKVAAPEEVIETEDDGSSWYDFMNPFSDNNDEPEEADSSSWYNFLTPESSNDETK
ncbi:MAG: outer membrane protein assembly factor BamD [Sulfurimonas sp.]|nr:outer membrane protein assembly factor BamD [Sulfurimonas sp.]